ncbi:MAG: hypothetical protein K5686_08410 [Lachnospiraceae bacterium]|nr:hypothetical protein [Lachnospiraceae bacterium]
MSAIDRLYRFCNECRLELHVIRKETFTRIVVLLPNDAEMGLRGSKMNVEVCEIQDADYDKCAELAAECAEQRYSEIMDYKREKIMEMIERKKNITA